jgi:hypothetical protein
MQKRRDTKKDIVDAFITEATNRLFTGDKRGGGVPAITLQNFYDESIRYGAKALRARLARLSRAELLAELNVAAKYVDARQERTKELITLAEQNEREEAARAHRQRQAELGRRHRLQPGILAAAYHYRALKKTAKEAWGAIKQNPLTTSEGARVIIERDGKEEIMCVASRDGKQTRSGIKFNHWQRRYWPAAKPDFR